MDSMNWKKTSLDDVIFENRNKAYGAYFLRQKYSGHVKKAALVGTSLFLLMVSSPLIADKMKGNYASIDNTVVTMAELPKVAPPPVEPPKPKLPVPPPEQKQIRTISFTPPKVMDNPIEEPPLPKMDEITAAVSTKTQDGVEGNLPPIAAPEAPPVGTEEPKKVEAPKDEVLLIVEQQPEFENGVKAMYDFLSKNIVYPNVARENGIEGIVYIGFVVSKDGTIRDVHFKRGIGGGCNEEAMRVVKMMPRWKPGKQNGKAVNVAFTIPVKFKLS
jgi:periplasmic protein TonB